MMEKLPRKNWRIASFSSEETNDTCGRASDILDGNRLTFWHSRWTSEVADFPHFVAIDLGKVHDVHRFSVTQRHSFCRAVKDLDLLISIDGLGFKHIDSYVIENNDGSQIFNFPRTLTMRFLKIVANSAWDGERFAALACTETSPAMHFLSRVWYSDSNRNLPYLILGAGSKLDRFLDSLGIEDKWMYDRTKDVLVREGITLDQLYTEISDRDLQDVGVPEIPRKLIKTAVQVP
jgi:hypothetical protein